MAFDRVWLDLRAPADLRARDAGLLAKAIVHAGRDGRVLDLGCGTGATVRAFAAAGAQDLDWCLLDNDQALLSEARMRHPGAEIRLCDLTDLDMLPLTDVRLVSASALFDLVSEAWARRLVERLARTQIALYAALSYDGVMRWTPQDSSDAEVTERFNRHQRGDKGFGPALGPDAGARLAEMLRARGYQVLCAPSPWHLGPQDAKIQALLLSGIAEAAQEAGFAGAERWATRRRRMIARSRVEIGHLDLLAVPCDG